MKSLDSQKSVEVYRRGNSLVASFHRSTPPLVWRFDLERNHSFTLALQGDDNEWELGLTSPKGDFQPVAHFAVREDAEEAFVKVENALSKDMTSWFKLFLKILAGLAVIALTIGVLPSLLGRPLFQSSRGSQVYNTSASAGLSNNPQAKAGVPVSADDFLAAPSP